MTHDMRGAGYEDRYVAYLDIMGYKELIRASTDRAAALVQIGRLRGALVQRHWVRELTVNPYTSVRVEPDAVVVSCSYAPVGCFEIVRWAMNVIGGGMAYRDFWVRGAVTRGYHYDDGEVMFSPAMVEAYETERQEAFYPRVLASAQVAQDCDRVGLGADAGLRSPAHWDLLRATLKDSIWMDAGGRRFLNYLSLIDRQRLQSEQPEQAFLRSHVQTIADHPREHAGEPRIAAKYGWLASYHNRFCRECLPPDLTAQYRIPDEVVGASLTAP